MRDPYRYFRVESRELCDEITRGLLDLEREPGALAEVSARLLRAAHTLKGAARVVGLRGIADRCHALEDAIVSTLDAGSVPTLLARVDDIAAQVAALDRPAAKGAREGPGAPRSALDPELLDRALEALSGARLEAGALRRGLARIDALRAAVASGHAGDLDRGLSRVAHELEGGLDALDRHLVRLDARAHDLRLVPAAVVFTDLDRAARDAARALDKQIRFEARGGEIRLDAGVLGLLREALLHLVQNAVDHGIERPAERVARGLPAAGKITVEITRRGHEVRVVCRDDGRGIDAEAVRRAAAARGNASGDAAASLVFEPGLSTRAEVGPTAGRGVGLDAVRAIAARLRGSVSVERDPSGGAAFRIRVPASLSSLPVLLVEGSEQRASLPLASVRRVARVGDGDLTVVCGRPAMRVDGREIPRLDLDAWLGAGARARPRAAAIVEAEDGVAALGVTRVIGPAHAIVELLPRAAGTVAVLGASLDHDGVAQIVLDPTALVSAARAPRPPAEERAPTRRSVLVVDDSLTSRTLEQSILSSAGYDVDTASSGEEALRKAREKPHDLFLVDVEMEGMSGFEFVARTRREQALSRVPVIIVSSRSSAEDRRRGLRAGARAYLTKAQITESSFLDLVHGLSR